MLQPDQEPSVWSTRQVKLPEHFKDFEVEGLGVIREFPPPSLTEETGAAAQGTEETSRNPSPASQLSHKSDLLKDEWHHTLEEIKQENEELRTHLNQLPQLKSLWSEMPRENEQLRSHVQYVPDIMAMLQNLTQENAALKRSSADGC